MLLKSGDYYANSAHVMQIEIRSVSSGWRVQITLSDASQVDVGGLYDTQSEASQVAQDLADAMDRVYVV